MWNSIQKSNRFLLVLDQCYNVMLGINVLCHGHCVEREKKWTDEVSKWMSMFWMRLGVV